MTVVAKCGRRLAQYACADECTCHPNFVFLNCSQPGSNNIEVSCESPVMYAQRKNAERNRTSYQLQPTCPQHQQHGQCFVNLIRKMQCSFSWDWGPSFPSTGIW
ncbi:hypothetical protein HPB48_013593 [Haemaphysalis longicornis]|uniref:Beta-mannosidase-like galactose-binding domain-containing protein n=1 Tax=Haemaphysalis longicornis TaxID=44386 RepID=A0A9J6GXN0_HAELO|nr:hypothetical protein HPB48_013593 [Haemaphysalis longicornis]